MASVAALPWPERTLGTMIGGADGGEAAAGHDAVQPHPGGRPVAAADAGEADDARGDQRIEGQPQEV